jgi:hypothetical protein
VTAEASFSACGKAGINASSVASRDQPQCDTPSDIKGQFFANVAASFPVLHKARTGGVMQIGEFNRNISAKFAAVVANGAPTLITRYRDHQPYVTVIPHDLFEDLLAAAGKKGQRVLARHEAAARNRAIQEELPLTAA